MSRLTRDRTAKPVSRNQVLRRERGQGIFSRSADHRQDWQPYAVDLYSAICDDHTCIRIYCSVYPQLPPVIGTLWGSCGHASGISFPRLLWFGVCASHATPCSVPGCSYLRMCLEKSERNCLTSYLYNAAIPASLWAMAKNGSTRCFFGQKRMYLKTIAAESVVGRIWLANTHYPFLAKSDRVLPVIATLLSFHPFLAILCSFPVDYSTARTDQHGPQEQLTSKFRRGDVEGDKIFSFFCKQFWE